MKSTTHSTVNTPTGYNEIKRVETEDKIVVEVVKWEATGFGFLPSTYKGTDTTIIEK